MRILWNENIQPDHKVEIEKCLHQLEWLVPKWVQEIAVNMWNGDEAEKMLSVEASYAYRFVRLNVYTNWLNQGPEDKFRQMVHEILHIPLTTIVDYAHEALKTTLEGSPQGAVILNELDARHESATQDLAHAICEKVYLL